MTAFAIRKLSDCPNSQKIAAEIFLDGFYPIFSIISKDRTQLTQLMQGCFNENVFYVAYADSRPVALAACSNNKERALSLDRRTLKDLMGNMGAMIYRGIKPEFLDPLPYPADTGYIECMATKEAERGKGAATALTQYMIQELPYREYILQTVDTNQGSIHLFEKLGFREFQRIPERNAIQRGYSARIYMKR